jgi:hypothetical protein
MVYRMTQQKRARHRARTKRPPVSRVIPALLTGLSHAVRGLEAALRIMDLLP